MYQLDKSSIFDSMSTTELKSSINQLLHGITDNSVLQTVYDLLSNSVNGDDWYDALSDESKASIKQGIDDAENGRFVSEENVQAKVNLFLGRK